MRGVSFQHTIQITKYLPEMEKPKYFVEWPASFIPLIYSGFTIHTIIKNLCYGPGISQWRQPEEIGH